MHLPGIHDDVAFPPSAQQEATKQTAQGRRRLRESNKYVSGDVIKGFHLYKKLLQVRKEIKIHTGDEHSRPESHPRGKPNEIF